MDAESHVNYLVTLFQVLRASGVREESFVSAFRLMGLSPQLTGAHTTPTKSYLIAKIYWLSIGS